MEKKNRNQSDRNHNSNHVVAEREGARVGATSTTEQIAGRDLLDGAKSRHAVLKDGAKQLYHPGCVLDLTIDFSPWCPSCLGPNSSVDPSRRCAYCYAITNGMYLRKTRSVDPAKFAAQLHRKIQQRASRGLPTRCLRIGKITDAGHRFFRRQLKAVLLTCAEVGLPVVFPTKFLEFDPEIAELMIAAKTIYMPSLGVDRFEPGAVLWGMHNGARMHEGLRYQDAGVITAPFVLIDPTRQFGGSVFEPVFRAAVRSFDRVVLLAIRLRTERLARWILGDWEGLSLAGPNGEPPRFEVAKNGARIAVMYHPSILRRIGKNNGRVRMCAHNSQQSHCGACFVPGEVGTVTGAAPATVLAQLAKANPNRNAEVNTADLAKVAGPGRSS